MPDNNPPAPVPQQSARFLYLYALAVAGGAVAYIPFLTILLPLRAADLTGGAPLSLLAMAAFVGAISASLANIGFGWASDRSAARQPWIITGLLLSSALLLAMTQVTRTQHLIGLIIAWQAALNMMLAPLAAWAGDTIPDRQKGLLGGLLALAPALGAASGALVTLPAVVGPIPREALVVMLVIAMVSPVLLFGRPRAMPHLTISRANAALTDLGMRAGHDAAVRMWIARLLVQIAEASMFAFLLLWFRTFSPGFKENDSASIFAIVLGSAVVLALITGRWSDRAARPITPLIWGSGLAAAGLMVMAFAPTLPLAVAGYVLFGVASSVFLALHSSQTLRVLPRAATRGRDLGIFNLTNTVPSLIMPWLTLALVPRYGFDALFLLFAGLAAAACAMLIATPRALQAGRRA